jgi:hypothetical protein
MELAIEDVGAAAPSARRASPAFGPTMSAKGYLVYGRENSLVAQRFDERTLRLDSEVAIITPLQYEHLFGWLVPAFSVSQNGALLYREGSLKVGQFSIVDRRGNSVGEVGERAEWCTFTVSDDGRTIVAGRSEPDKYGIWAIDAPSGRTSRLTSSTEQEADPTFGLAGFVTFLDSLVTREVREVPVTGGAPTRRLAGEVFHDRTRDGEWLLVGELASLRARSVKDQNRVVDLVNDGRYVDEAPFSPDGRAVAYNSSESGRFEAYVVRMPATGEKLKVSFNGGVQPRWRADGRGDRLPDHGALQGGCSARSVLHRDRGAEQPGRGLRQHRRRSAVRPLEDGGTDRSAHRSAQLARAHQEEAAVRACRASANCRPAQLIRAPSRRRLPDSRHRILPAQTGESREVGVGRVELGLVLDAERRCAWRVGRRSGSSERRPHR